MRQLGILGGRDASCYSGCSSDVLVRKGAPDFGGKEKTDGIQIRKRRHQMGRQMHVVVPRYLLRLRHRCGSSRHRGRYDFVADIIRTWHDPCCCCCNERLCGSFHQQLHQVRLQHRSACATGNIFSSACNFSCSDIFLHRTASRTLHAILSSALPSMVCSISVHSCCCTGFIGAFVGNTVVSHYIQKYKKTCVALQRSRFNCLTRQVVTSLLPSSPEFLL